MSIFEAIGLTWVILTSALATAAVFYLAFVGMKTVTSGNREVEVPVEVREMFRAR